jgi:DNA-binding response OmpR family regulator
LKVLLVGGDLETRELVDLAVRLRWPEVCSLAAPTAGDGLRLLYRENPNVVLLYPNLPDLTLADAVREVRALSEAPLLILGEDEEENQVAEALDLGADDYVKIPCNLADLSVRVWALIRRAGETSTHNEGSWEIGPLVIYPDNYKVAMEGRRIPLTSTEFRLLHLLVKNRGHTLPHCTIEQAIWQHRVDSNRLVKKYVQRLRRKLGDDARYPEWIASVHGVGYRFIGPPELTLQGNGHADMPAANRH